MKKYPEYKDSGLAWLSDVPAHWQILKGKRLFKRMNRPIRDEDGIVTAFRDGTVTLRSNRRTEGFTNSLKEIGYQGIRKGDLVIHAMDAFAGAIGVSDSDGKSTPVYSACRPIKDANVFYYSYLLKLMAQRQFILSLAKGIRERSSEFRFNEFADLELPVPTPEEQETIVKFLDRKLEEIVRFISNKQKLIELLKEQKTALINRAVTRGINPDVKFKHSSIEWLGDVPEHWDVAPLYARYWVQLGKMLDSKRITGEYLAPYLRNIDVQWDSINTNDLPQMDFSFDDRKRFSLRFGDLLVCEGGEVGRTAMWRGELDECFYQKALHRLRPKQSCNNPQYFYFVMRSAVRLGVFVAGSNSNTIDHLTAEKLKTHRFPFPPLSEQNEIASFLEMECSKINQVITKAEREIELIKEYRTALISEAVTGKIDVRIEAAQVQEVSIAKPKQDKPYFMRTVLAAEIVHQLHGEVTFGRVKFQKLLYLVEHHAKLTDFQTSYLRDAAGPHDNSLIRSVERQLERTKWYKSVERKPVGHKYIPLEKAGGHKKYLNSYWGNKLPMVQEIIDLLKPLDTERCEIIATLYAAWNDLMISGEEYNDDSIIYEVLNRWHEHKQEIPEDRWRKALEWMRTNNLTPTGFGKPTRHKN